MDDAYYSRVEADGPRTRRRRRKPLDGSANDKKERLTRHDWILMARKALILGGVGAVRIVPLAKKLKVTRGGFYWHFQGRQDLLDALLQDWVENNTAAFDAVLSRSGHNGRAEFQAFVNVWVEETDYQPAWDTAVRNWARLSSVVADVVKRVDRHRIDILRKIFLDIGYRDPQALVRARITYFHQVGYYTLGLEETRERRLELMPTYMESLIGRPTG